MSMFQSNATAKNNDSPLIAIGTNAGCSITFAAVPNKSIWLDKVTGSTDATSSVVEATYMLTGTIATGSSSKTVVGTATLFTTELQPGNIVREENTGELLQVDTITNDTHFQAKVASGNTDSGSVGTVVFGNTSVLANKDIAWNANGTVKGNVGMSLTVTVVSSTATCFMNASMFTLG